MFDSILQYLAPHYCKGCGVTGATLCHNCKQNITDESSDLCIYCPTPSASGVCQKCVRQHPIQRAWSVALRDGVVKELLNDFKFVRKRMAYKALASLLADGLPYLAGNDVVLVPVPTISKHIRRRGYDHSVLLANAIAKKKGVVCRSDLVIRKYEHEQRGLRRNERIKSAKDAFYTKKAIDPDKLYIIIDDVTTTGATLDGVAYALKRAGVVRVAAAVIAIQPSTPAEKSVKM